MKSALYEIEPSDDEKVMARTKVLIRAYADNIADEMAQMCTDTIDCDETGERCCDHVWVANPQHIRAALLKGLE
jgi:hypothetical protein